MPFLNDRVYDNGLSVLDTEATHLHITTSEISVFGNLAAATVGNKSLGASDIGAPAAGTPNGRQVTIAALTGGSVTANGTASHYAIVDQTNSRILAAAPLSASQVVTSGNTFSTSSQTIRIPAPA